MKLSDLYDGGGDEIAELLSEYLKENGIENQVSHYGVVQVPIDELTEGWLGIQFATELRYTQPMMFMKWWDHVHGKRTMKITTIGKLPGIHDPECFPKILERIKNLDVNAEIESHDRRVSPLKYP